MLLIIINRLVFHEISSYYRSFEARHKLWAAYYLYTITIT
jgi:hypothetical protein